MYCNLQYVRNLLQQKLDAAVPGLVGYDVQHALADRLRSLNCPVWHVLERSADVHVSDEQIDESVPVPLDVRYPHVAWRVRNSPNGINHNHGYARLNAKRFGHSKTAAALNRL